MPVRRVKTRHADGRVTVDTVDVPPAGEVEELRRAVRAVVRPTLDDLDDPGALADLYRPWGPGIALAAGEIVSYDGRLCETVQGHITQAGWRPPVVPSLFRFVGRTDDGDVVMWDPGIALEVDVAVSYDGRRWSTVQAHTTQVGWEPDVTPALFEEVNDG